MTPEQERYNKERAAAYGRMVALADSHINAISPAFTLDLGVLAVTAAQQAAERDCWTLFRNGLRHLQDGGPGGRAGQIGAALSKTSLRASAAAQALGIKAPEFEEHYSSFSHVTGDLEALFYSRRLIEAALSDADKSGKIIQRAVGMAALPLHEPETSVEDRELARVFAAVRKTGAGNAPAAETGDLEAAVRRQAMLTAKVQPDIYRGVGEKFQEEILTLYAGPQAAPPSPPRGSSFGP